MMTSLPRDPISEDDERTIVTELNRVANDLVWPSQCLLDPTHPEYDYARKRFDIGVDRIEQLVANLIARRPVPKEAL
jgi:hypothetical protein